MTILSITTIDRGPAVTPTGDILATATAVAAPYGTPGPKIFGTSSSEVAITSSGAKTFVINEYGRSFSVGVRLRATSIPAGDWIEGVVTDYNENTRTLTLTADLASGAGTASDWNINVAGEQGQQGIQGIQGEPGDPGGPPGPMGPAGASQGNKYTFSGTITGDPGTGRFLLDNGNLSLATTLHISEVDGAGQLMTPMLAAMDEGTSARKTLVRFINPAGTKGILGYITAALTDQGNYDTYPWTPITSWGAPVNGDEMYLSWAPVGDKGETGAQGIQGIQGETGPQGIIEEAPIDGTTYGRKDGAWMVVVPASALTTPFTPAGNIAATNVQAALQEVDTEKVAKAGDTMTGDLEISKATPKLILKRPDATTRAEIAGMNGTEMRWSIVPGNAAAEGGGNAGSDFTIIRYDDNGTLIDVPVTISRSTGLITLIGDPTAALGAATKQYVDTRVRFDAAQALTATQQAQGRANIYAAPFDALAYNGIQINGGMEISQAIGSALQSLLGSPAQLSGYLVDQFAFSISDVSGTIRLSAQQVTDAPPGYRNSLKLQVTTALASPGVNDFVTIYTRLEGMRTVRLRFGGATAQPLSIGFWVKAHRAGLYTGCVLNVANDRNCPVSFTINAADTWEFKTVTIPGDTSGTWATGTDGALQFGVCMVAGSSVVGTANVWAAGFKIGATGQINGVAAITDTFQITGVMLLPGNELPSAERAPFLMRPYADELFLCQRYYAKTYDPHIVPGTIATVGSIGGVSTGTAQRPFVTWPYPRVMRATPSVTYYSPVTGTVAQLANLNTSGDVGANSYSVGMASLTFYPSGTLANGDAVVGHITASARLS